MQLSVCGPQTKEGSSPKERREVSEGKKKQQWPPQTTGKPSQECHQHGLESEEAIIEGNLRGGRCHGPLTGGELGLE